MALLGLFAFTVALFSIAGHESEPPSKLDFGGIMAQTSIKPMWADLESAKGVQTCLKAQSDD